MEVDRDRVPCGVAFQENPLGLIFTPCCAIPYVTIEVFSQVQGPRDAMLFDSATSALFWIKGTYSRRGALQPHPANTPDHGVTPDRGSRLGPSIPELSAEQGAECSAWSLS